MNDSNIFGLVVLENDNFNYFNQKKKKKDEIKIRINLLSMFYRDNHRMGP